MTATSSTRNALAESYLDLLARRGVTVDQTLATMRQRVDLAATSYGGRSLPRPAFLSYQEQRRLAYDLAHLVTALTSLPDRRYGGDLGAFARAAGMSGSQTAAVVRGGGTGPTRLSRADLHHDGDGFRLMELNLSSALGSLDNALLNRAFLAHPAVREFVETHQLSYVDTLAEVVATLRAVCDLPEGQRPFVAAVDWPDSFETLEAQLRYSAAELTRYGLDAAACHLGHLEYRGGRIWLADRPVDIVYRIFLLEDLARPEGPELIEPVLRAVERGEVKLFLPIDAELYGSKSALAMLSEEVEAPDGGLDPGQRASIDRLLPWTRMVRPGAVTAGGSTVDLWEYALAHRAELVLKPASLHGGAGVVLGWQVPPERWRAELAAALGGPWVLQRRVRPAPELFPALAAERAAGTDRQPWLLNWGVFETSRGYGGAVVRGSTDLTGSVVNLTTGAVGGCCFHQSGPDGADQSDPDGADSAVPGDPPPAEAGPARAVPRGADRP